MEKFRKLKISGKILKAIESSGYKEPTEIQEKTIPSIIEGKDVIGSSATGSGKTFAFGSGIIDKIIVGMGVQALILTPTRELANQISKHLKIFAQHYDINITEVYGGVGMEPQVRAISHSEIVVGTPGRILDHIGRRSLNLGKVRFLILDEADRMLEMGFIEDVEKIINECPKERQTLLFSATIPLDVQKIARKYMKNPINIEVDAYVDPSKLYQIYYDLGSSSKFSLLVHLLKKEKSGLVMVFCNTRRNTDVVAKNLIRYGINALAIHGGLSQNQRDNVMKAFHSQRALILVCTDVAARGLDIKGVSHIYNYDTPKNSTDYIHRIGRTARAGKKGIAVSLVAQRDYDNFREVCKNPDLNIEKVEVPKDVEILEVSFVGRSSFRGGGFRDGGMRRGGFRGRQGGQGGGFGGRRDDRRSFRGGDREGQRSGRSYGQSSRGS